MTLTFSPNAQRGIAVGLTLVALAVIGLPIVWPLWSSVELQNERVAMLRRQAQTLEALVAAAPRYQTVANSLAANGDSRSLVFVVAQPTLAVADLQGKLSSILNKAGVTVTASQALPEQQQGGLVKLAVQATLEVEIGPLVDALHAMAAQRPLLRVEKLIIHEPDAAMIGAGPEPNVPNKLQAEIVVSAFMRQP
jgi:hypothetical protein